MPVVESVPTTDQKTVSDEDRNATRSWSGYLYQGKVGIMVALKQIASVRVDNAEETLTALEGWTLVFENHEDFDIKSPVAVVSRHQIKALMDPTAHTKGAYGSALRAFSIEDDCPVDSRFLHTVKEITNWDDSSVDNPKNVQRYIYPNGHTYCALTGDTIQNHCTEYIRKIRPNNPENLYMSIYHYLLGLLIKEVNRCHSGEAERDSPVLSLPDIFRAIMECPIDEIFTELQIIRLRALLVEALYNLEEDILLNDGEYGVSWDAAKQLVDDLCSLADEDLMRFLKDIHPEKDNFGKLYDFNSSGFKYVFLELLRKTEKTYDLQKRGYYSSGQAYLLSTISDDEGSKIANAIRVLENPNNTRLMFEGKNIVTKNLEFEFSNLDGRKYEGGNILDPENIRFVRVTDTIHELGGGD